MRTTNFNCMETIASSKLKFQLSQPAKAATAAIISWMCMALFLYTAYAKIEDHQRFLGGLQNVHLIGGMAWPISFLVPIVEILVAVLLLIPKARRAGFYGFITTMLLFTGYIISVLIWEKHLPCHCGGAVEKLSWTQHILFNAAFILLAIVGVRLTISLKSKL